VTKRQKLEPSPETTMVHSPHDDNSTGVKSLNTAGGLSKTVKPPVTRNVRQGSTTVKNSSVRGIWCENLDVIKS
jgi:hypothetical protein